jgi:RNA polymerase sigma-70 factor (ECF subfamily)
MKAEARGKMPLSEQAETDPAMAAALARRERSAWTRAFDQHGADVYALIACLVRGNQTLAEDLHQEVWLAAIDRISQFSPARGALRNWLLAIARNRVTQHYRQQTGRRTIATSELAGQTADEHDAAFLPDDLLECVERQDVVRASLAMLTAEAREALVLKYVTGLAVNDIAARTGRTPKGIESLLSRARAQLRKLLDWYFTALEGEERK